MVYDVDDAVAVQSMKLLAKLVEKGELPIGEIHHVYEILMDEATPLRSAAAEFVCAVIKADVKQKVLSDGGPLLENHSRQQWH